ncbi:hypothetical protein Dsin_033004 [Dipteronia sinensis]|uniref:Ca3427-like PBP 2 domain-containing protein n=1 Tax=Dipteronia sinensis TaxID=43782 RepID=A0AAD9Z651_9ROSI|nr:hypothetical protein Dsin_033004 [Dipteronia sinensis]
MQNYFYCSRASTLSYMCQNFHLQIATTLFDLAFLAELGGKIISLELELTKSYLFRIGDLDGRIAHLLPLPTHKANSDKSTLKHKEMLLRLQRSMLSFTLKNAYDEVQIQLLPIAASGLGLKPLGTWNITTDVQGSFKLNGVSFQEDVLVTAGNYQYIAFYSVYAYGQHYVNVGRRVISPSVKEWQYITLKDYIVSSTDGHNVVSMGISGDGKIHLSFDHHDTVLKYRTTRTGAATVAASSGLPPSLELYKTPCRVPPAPGHRSPIPGSRPLPMVTFSWSFVSERQWSAYGKYLQGQDNNAYINGLDSINNRLSVSWCVRETPDANTNHDLFYAYSDDNGQTWKGSNGSTLVKPITPSILGAKVYDIPQNSQMVNQEGQVADSSGRFHVLMRDALSGTSMYYHYLRDSRGIWSKRAIDVANMSPPTLYLNRGKLAIDSSANNLIALLPDDPKLQMKVYGSTAAGDFRDWTLLATIPNAATEPLFDRARLRQFGILSLFIRQGGGYPYRKVQVYRRLLAISLTTSTLPLRGRLLRRGAYKTVMITLLRKDEIDVAIGLTEGWVAGLLNDEGQKLQGYNIVGSLVQNPLRWAIVTGRNRDDINSVEDLRHHRRVGVSRIGSGSHVMAFVLAQEQGWLQTSASAKDEGMTFVVLGPFTDLRKGVTGSDEQAPTADFFMWEHFTTKPFFNDESSPLKRIGEIYTPWPSWHIAASSLTFPRPDESKKLAQLFDALDLGVKNFNANPDQAVQMLGTGELGCHYTEEDAREWLKSVKFFDVTRGVDNRTMDGVVKVLQGAGVIEPSTEVKDGDGVVAIPRPPESL